MKRALRWWWEGCVTAVCCLGVVLGGVVVVVHLVTAWVTGHAWVVWFVVVMAATGGVIGSWASARREDHTRRDGHVR